MTPTLAQRQVAWWCWGVSAFLILVGVVGLFTENIGPMPTNRLHAVGLNLGVGLVGFGFARFSEERAFVLLAGIGMLALAVLGFIPATQAVLYPRLHMNMAESVLELAGGVVSLALWARSR
ncbi:MAG TPA: hypothetical protein VLT45_22785 [Kofleriaceae bacterium]|nr:hypothetical protein [Kofleriaceae bacterium]